MKTEISSSPSEQVDVLHVESTKPLDFEDPHRAALEDNPEQAERPSGATVFAVISLALSFIGPVSCGFSLITSIVIQVTTALGDTSGITWIVGGWSIASSVSFSIAGSLSDIFGRRWTIISGQIFSVIGSIISASAQSTSTLIAGSTVIGFGAGIVFVAYAGIAELLPNKWRGTGIGFCEFCITIPWVAAATLIATSLASHAPGGWRWCFFLAIIFGVVSMIGTILFYFPPKRPQFDFQKTRWEECRELDYLGCALYTTGLVVSLIGVTWAGTPGHAWKSASVIAPIVIGVSTLIACFAYDFTVAKQPIFPLGLFRQGREFTVLLAVVFVAGMVYYTMAALLPQGSLYMFESDPIKIGVMQLPNGIGQVIFGGLATLAMGWIGHLKLQIIIMLCVQTAFTGAYAGVIPGNRAAWVGFQFFSQGAFPLITLVCYVVAGLNIPLKHLGIATGLIGTFRSFGGSVGNAIFNTVLNTVVNEELPKRIAAVAVANDFPIKSLGTLIQATILNAVGVPGAFQQVPGITTAVEVAATQALKDAYGKAFSMMFYATIPFGVIAIICACFIKDPSMYLTNHTAVHMERQGILEKKSQTSSCSPSKALDNPGMQSSGQA